MEQNRRRRERYSDNRNMLIVMGGIVGIAALSAMVGVHPATLFAQIPAASCNIKGNISIGSGEQIYQVPGQEDYEATIIRPEFGERWFCTEREAIQAGWRKAGR